MTYSSYQVQRLLERLRRLGRWLAWPAHRPWAGADPVRTSAAARQAARDASSPASSPVADPTAGSPAGPLGVADVREARQYEPVVEAERERRAGSFMQPPYPPEPPPDRIPKRPRDAVPRPRTRSLGEG